MAYRYIGGELQVESGQFSLAELTKSYDRPIYFYNLADLSERVRALVTSFSRPVHIHYAVKANGCDQILKTLFKEGCGADVVSLGEMHLAVKVGLSPSRVVFSGVGKTVHEITEALRMGVGQLNVESPAELTRISKVAAQLGLKAPIAFRMNPDVNPDTHPYIKTGFRDNKFGMDIELLKECLDVLVAQQQHLDFLGLTMHIGSQLRDLEALCEGALKLKKMGQQLESKGFPIRSLDLGGGLGIDYQNFAGEEEFQFIADYGRRLSEILSDFDGEIHLEPGRVLVARSGLLLTQVQYIKRTPYKNFAIVDTGMHHLLRPALYQGFHRILPLREPRPNEDMEVYDVVGPICESSDVLGFDRLLPKLEEGDFLAIADVGAYGMSMASHYNVHPMPKEISWPSEVV